MNLVLLTPEDFSSPSKAVLTGVRFDHIRRVLKLGENDQVKIGVIDGAMGVGRITGFPSADSVALECMLDQPAMPASGVDVLLALPRPKILKRLLPQLAALGVHRIMLSNAWKVERNYFDTHVLEAQFIRTCLIEGLQQAGDTRMPLVTVHRKLVGLVEDDLDALCPEGLRLVAQPGENTTLTGAIVRNMPSRVLLAIGPEGGWLNEEIELLKAHRFLPVGLGDRTLRTDTACIALLAVAKQAIS